MQRKYTACSSAKAPLSLDSASTSDDDNDVQSGPHPQVPPKSQWTLPSHLQKNVIYTLTEGPRGNNDSETSHVNDGCKPLSIFILYFAEIVTLLVVKTNIYYHWCFVSFHNGPSSQNYGTEAEMFVFVAVTIQMGHCLPDQLTDHWAKLDQFYTPFYSTIMRQNK